MKLFQELNRDQADRLAGLSFDIAKGVFALSLFPPFDPSISLEVQVLKIILGVFAGLAFVYTGLLLLKLKEKIK